MSNFVAFLLLGLAACCVLPTLANSLFAQTSKAPAATKTLPQTQPATKKANIQPTQSTNDGRGSAPGRASLKDADEGDTGRAPAGQRQARPEGQSYRVPNVSPELMKVLQDWEVESAKVKRLTGSFKRWVYDNTFETEKRSDGSFAFEAPDKGNYVLTPVEVKKGEASRRKNANGEPYKLVVDLPERWVCNGVEVIKIDEKQKQYEKVTIPEDERGQNIIDGPLPFLFGMKANQAIRRYKMSFPEKQTPEGEIWLDVEPRWPQDAANWKTSRVIIDAKTFLPKAVQMVDPTGNKITVHTFSGLEANKRNSFFSGDPFQPNLKNYKLVMNERPSGAPANSGPTNGASATPKSRTSTNERTDRDLQRTAELPSTASGKKSTTGTVKK